MQRAEEVAELEIQPRPRRIGTLGTPTSSSAHGSAPPAGDRLHCALPNGRTRLLISANGDKCTAPESLQFGFLCPPRAGVAAKRPGVDRPGP